jgi:hypothetical protein
MSQNETKIPLFVLSQIVATRGALAARQEAGQTPAEFLNRHVSRRLGELDQEDSQLNNLALFNGSRILSAYKTRDGANRCLALAAVFMPSEELGQLPSIPGNAHLAACNGSGYPG